MLQVISLLLENKPGALMRVTGVLTARGYNIESLTVARTLDPALSRMTITVDVDASLRGLVIKQMNKLINVVQDTDLTDLDDYKAYTGNGRRLITIPVVDALNTAGGMLVLGFRQFIVQPRTDLTLTALDPSDSGGRFVATYIGSVAPVRSGIVGGCPQQTAGPGKVVLHQ